MSLAYHELKASYAFVERNINLVKRYWGWEVVWMLYTIANSLAVVLIAKGTNSAIGTEALADAQIDAFILFLAIGALVWHYLAVVFQTVSEMISWERWEGTIEYTFMAPVRRGTHMVGTALFSLVYGLLHTAVVLVVIVLVFDLDMGNANYVSATAVLVAGSLSLVGIGIMGAVLPLLYPERGAEMTHVIQAALVLISGIYIKAGDMPEPLATMSIFSPARYVIEGIRSALIDGKGFGDLWLTIVGLIASGFVMIPAGVWVFSLGERYAKRTGRLKRSG
ncbi:MAG: ABC transporter permease [Dehalococcoidia bacterium]|uniref:ABC transporter permease n=1 Tax=Candidatus Amarobacter glycogenicus TaxID=3140699 RepID=UPI003135E2FE|nr:ABC transporter permease [Dehalococcoidia bacterium]MBK6563028.1 ABC transporter permease [Dehalococcoidia bacterium]MBK7126676.1 ABC transporter permease [Dehalococcoidia bacterium]MBK8561626.1 ABC transporter permease [Dehalococcoidia bacterium]MBK9546579.1 ABC transporter permease [Dehalococcoidia bacterium]